MAKQLMGKNSNDDGENGNIYRDDGVGDGAS